jgi:RHS repeat-associated protein
VHGARLDEIVLSLNPATGEQAYHHYDARTHAILLTNSSGSILEQYEYDVFGQPYVFAGNGASMGESQYGNRFLFTGREWLKGLDIYDYRHRLYQPELGRFLQPDPKHFAAGDYNLYRYCHNDPINKSDPTGLITIVMPGAGPQRKGSNEAFIQKMMKKFKDAVVFGRHQAAQNRAVEAVKAARANGDNTVNIAAYSRGVIGAIQTAAKLGNEGITVNNLVTVDPVTVTGNSGSIAVPSNVQKAQNFYQGGARMGPLDFPGTPLAPGPNVSNTFYRDGLFNGYPVRHENMPSIAEIDQ